MKTLLSTSLFLLLASAFMSAEPAAGRALGPRWAGPAVATTVVFQGRVAFATPVAPTGGTQNGVGPLPTSVIPPGSNPGEMCSAQSPQECSAMQQQQRCSALNGLDQQCSIFFDNVGQPQNGRCSAFMANSVCSVLPSNLPHLSESGCSVFSQINDGINFIECSAVGLATRQLCSVKGIGDSKCSAIADPGPCSVLNQGSPFRSFCSAKTGQATPGAKQCSTFIFAEGMSIATCSIEMNGNGACTAFGQAPTNSCSAFVASSFCSVIFQSPGQFCQQP